MRRRSFIVPGDPSLQDVAAFARAAGAPGSLVAPPQGSTQQIEQGETRTLLRLEGAGPGSRTLILTSRDDPTPAQIAGLGALSSPIYGRVYLGFPSVSEFVEVDWNNGTCLNVPTGAVSVDVVYPANPSSATGWRYRVGAYLHQGSLPGGGPVALARRTVNVGSIAVSTRSTRQAIPPIAQSVALYHSPAVTAQVYGEIALHFCATPVASAAASLTLGLVVPSGPDPIALPAGTRSIIVENLSSTVGVSGALLVFSLSL